MYSTSDDLLLGNIPLPSYADPEKYIADAADEIDSSIGFVYLTPVDISDTSLVPKPARLLLKRVSNWLATGRLVLAVAAGGEQTELNAYGADLIKQATAILKQIADREIILVGAIPVEGTEDTFVGPQIHNVDAESNVEAFYDRVTNPNYFFGFPADAESRGFIR